MIIMGIFLEPENVSCKESQKVPGLTNGETEQFHLPNCPRGRAVKRDLIFHFLLSKPPQKLELAQD